MESSNDTDTGDTYPNASSSGAHIPPRVQMVNRHVHFYEHFLEQILFEIMVLISHSQVNTAVAFLQNPNVARNSIVQKENFLRSKGLNDEEIRLAFQQAGIFAKDPNSTIINMEIGHRTAGQQQSSSVATLSPLYRTPETALQKVYNIISSTAMVTGIVYAIYHVYKKFIEPFLFGRKKDKKSTTDQLSDLDKKMEKNIRKLGVEITALKDELRSSYTGDHVLRQDMLAFKNDLDAIKGLLLNRFVLKIDKFINSFFNCAFIINGNIKKYKQK